MAHKVTSADVGKLAGVSQTTVSMILNNSGGARFSEKTRAAVQDAARELGYIAHKPKPPLSKKTQNVLVLVPTLDNQYYAELGCSLESFSNSAGVKVIVCSTFRKSELEKYYLEFFTRAGIDGVIYAFLPSFPRLAEKINREIPVVLIGAKQEDLDICSIEFSNVQSARLLFRHLYGLGHRRFAFITTALDQLTLARRQRLEGLRQAAAEQGVEEDAIEVFSPGLLPGGYAETDGSDDLRPYEFTVGKKLTEAALAAGCRATAIIGVNDMVAVGALRALDEAGRAAPGDFSVCGFDNIFISSVTSPGITTIDHQLSSRSQTALSMIAARNGNERSINSARRIEYAPQLVIRGSTGAPPKSKI